jgi:hypothetical protein
VAWTWQGLSWKKELRMFGWKGIRQKFKQPKK